MGIANLHEYTEPEYKNLDIKRFKKPIRVSHTDHPDDKVDIQPQGWVGEDAFVFIIATEKQNTSTVGINNLANILIVDVVSDQGSNKTKNTYWTVDAGTGNGKLDDWSMTFEVERDGKDTGKWVFDKGDNDDNDSKKPGCLGIFATLLT